MAAAIALLLAGAALAAPARSYAAVSTAKVVIIVGPTEGDTSTYRADGDLFYKEAIKYTPNVVKVYSPNATWAAVSAAMQGASIVVFLGHGAGFPNPYTTSLKATSEDGFGLNASANNGDSNAAYYGEAYIRSSVHLAPNAVVIFNHACYAPGAASGVPDPTLVQARQRIDNYASGFLAAGAAAVFATDYYGAQSYIDALFTTRQTLDSLWRHTSDAQGHFFSFASTRTPGTTDEADPTTTSSGPAYHRSLSGRIGTITTDVVKPLPDTTAPSVRAPVSGLYVTTLGSTSVPVRTSWSASDVSGVAGYGLRRLVSGSWLIQPLRTPSTTAIGQSLAFGSAARYAVRATDKVGNVSGWVAGASVVPLLTQESSSAVAYAGAWTAVANGYASGGHLRYTTARGGSATYTFTGASIGWVAYRGPNRGTAAVYVDGIYRGSVNLYSAYYYARQIVYAFNWGTNGTHTIRIVGLGTSGHPRVDIDAFVRLSNS
ncbi:MAG TPA: hypothetical protein VE011_09310 [Candidatus Dormibacteraeota bacterium]|nr:hypothetical protein [Candidatus Dormibacteraeota bacterium]